MIVASFNENSAETDFDSVSNLLINIIKTTLYEVPLTARSELAFSAVQTGLPMKALVHNSLGEDSRRNYRYKLLRAPMPPHQDRLR